ncbi:CBM35 domain-containing protein [Streptomyces sp. NPDC001663]|uniref:CBM35 domain-containing protein n=1 Tax=Streptomyces sp. NPDC001663 TaxID=3364597 RepID=UPI00367A5C87
MTSGNNGASTPEDDDPFGYLYADGQANGAQPPSGGYGYPNSVNRVRAVGQRQYGQPAQPQQTAAYGQVPQQQGTYGQPNANYAAPETFPGAAPTAPQQPAYGGGGGRRGPNTKGLLIGAIAVVAAVVIGIGVAMLGGDSSDDKADGGASTSPSSAAQSSKPSQSASASAAADLPKTDAKDLQLGGGAATASDVDGAKGDGGVYVTGFNNVGASITWTVDIQKAGSYRLYVQYSIPAVDANATLTVNGKPNQQPLGMKNFIKSSNPDLAKNWQSTWAPVKLSKGSNTLTLSCGQGNQCNALVDQLWLQ